MITTYVGYPIDQASLDPYVVELIVMLEDMLRDATFSVLYDPGDAFKVYPNDGPLPQSIARVNAMALNSADVMVAFLPAGVPTIGLILEVERSVRAGRRTVILTNTKSYSLAEYASADNVSQHGLDEDGVRQAVEMLRTEAEDGLLRPRTAEDGPEALPVLLGPGGRLPSRGYADDAGLDLYVVGDHVIGRGMFYDLPCEVSVELPPWTWGLITGRSSTLRNRGLLVHSGIIDPGWRGTLFAGAFNTGIDTAYVKDGERIAQLIILPNVTREFEPTKVDQLSEHPRGSKGFGSTGV